MPCPTEKISYKAGYENLVAGLTKNHGLTTLSSAPPEIQRKIRLQAAEKFRPIFKEGQQTKLQENSGVTQYSVRRWRLDDGEVKFVDGVFANQTLKQLDIKTKTLAPSLYNENDTKTNDLIQQAFRAGATRVITSYEHQSGSRDLIVMELDPETNEGTIKVINTAPDGNYHTFNKIRSLAQEQFSNLATITPTNNVFILTDVSEIKFDPILSPLAPSQPQTPLIISRQQETSVTTSQLFYINQMPQAKFTPPIETRPQPSPVTDPVTFKTTRPSSEPSAWSTKTIAPSEIKSVSPNQKLKSESTKQRNEVTLPPPGKKNVEKEPRKRTSQHKTETTCESLHLPRAYARVIISHAPSELKPLRNKTSSAPRDLATRKFRGEGLNKLREQIKHISEKPARKKQFFHKPEQKALLKKIKPFSETSRPRKKEIPGKKIAIIKTVSEKIRQIKSITKPTPSLLIEALSTLRPQSPAKRSRGTQARFLPEKARIAKHANIKSPKLKETVILSKKGTLPQHHTIDSIDVREILIERGSNSSKRGTTKKRLSIFSPPHQSMSIARLHFHRSI